MADGRRYYGDWVEGKMQGKGRLTNSDGSYYEGEWMDNIIHGYGVKYSKDKTIIY